MTFGAVLAFLGIAVVDSINPSALVVTLQLLSRRAPLSAVLVYIGAVFLTYLSVTVLLVLGLGALLEPVEALLETTAANIVLALLGAAMLGYALFSRSPRGELERPPLKLSSSTASGLFLLGMSVTVMELLTAFPLLGAVALLTSASPPVATWLPLVLVYNVIFVMPPLLLTFGYRWLGERGGEALERRLRRGARETMLWVIGIIGFYVLAYALAALDILPDSASVGVVQ